ncbi:hypothetical protein VTN00DRAFT_4928 [Thermoascus crustaceus]|uniref:uncharacterized protein n=1 Tax=Thermoascus crustaceus TaxID=5088 RepID=UPI00374492A0
MLNAATKLKNSGICNIPQWVGQVRWKRNIAGVFAARRPALRPALLYSSVTPIFFLWIFRGSWSRTWRDVHDERWRTVRRTKGLAASGLALGRIAWNRGLDWHYDKRPGGQRLSASCGGGELRLRFASCRPGDKAVPRVFSNLCAPSGFRTDALQGAALSLPGEDELAAREIIIPYVFAACTKPAALAGLTPTCLPAERK